MRSNAASATSLPIYDRAIHRYSHLEQIPDAKHFCRQLCLLAAVDTITAAEYIQIGRVANGDAWQE